MAQEPQALISRRAYAKQQGCAPSHIVRMCDQGKIPLFIACPSGCGTVCDVTLKTCECGQAIAGVVDTSRAKIDPVVADRALEAARHPEKQHVADRHAAARGETVSPPDELDLEGDGESGDGNILKYAKGKAKREHYAALQAELDYRRKAGELGDLGTMRREAFKVARQVREGLTAIPDRLAPVLAAERETATVHALLLEEITRVLNELHRTIGSDEAGDELRAAG